jgi:hypothetical protein
MMYSFPTNSIELDCFPEPLKIRKGDCFHDKNQTMFVVADIIQNSDSDFEDVVIFKEFEPHFDTTKEPITTFDRIMFVS